jgi:hypothetical protein
MSINLVPKADVTPKEEFSAVYYSGGRIRWGVQESVVLK